VRRTSSAKSRPASRSVAQGVAVPEGASAHIAVVAGAVQPWHGVAGWSGAGSARFLQVFKWSGTSDRGCGLVGDGVFHAALLAAVGVTAALV
jgi:hypothetical protein